MGHGYLCFIFSDLNFLQKKNAIRKAQVKREIKGKIQQSKGKEKPSGWLLVKFNHCVQPSSLSLLAGTGFLAREPGAALLISILIRECERETLISSMTSFLDEFQADIELLPNILQKKYALLRDLDKSLQEILRQNEQRCEQEIEDLKQGLISGSITPDPSHIKFSDDALDEQKHSIRIADEKVALAVQAYDLVDSHIQQLDQFLKKSEEEIRRERELASATGSPDANAEGSTKAGRGSEGSRGGRKKTRLAAAAAAAATAVTSAPANPTSMDLDLPVDPNEPTYCLCNQVSYGEMVACDNPDCRIEWFHFGCVGLKEKPKGKWYCSDCAGTQKRRKGK